MTDLGRHLALFDVLARVNLRVLRDLRGKRNQGNCHVTHTEAEET